MSIDLLTIPFNLFALGAPPIISTMRKKIVSITTLRTIYVPNSFMVELQGAEKPICPYASFFRLRVNNRWSNWQIYVLQEPLFNLPFLQWRYIYIAFISGAKKRQSAIGFVIENIAVTSVVPNNYLTWVWLSEIAN